ncbi:MAG: ATP-binding cassette domain-containing protein [Cyanobacteria bacterium]|nr:ATP-binding cassette domain-containing protein [Cyanobacteriota bacterium]
MSSTNMTSQQSFHSQLLEGGGDHHLKPYQRLWLLLREERQDLIILVIYTLVSGLLSLTVPVAAQALVNTIAAGIFIQPLVILTLLLLVGLLFMGVLKLVQLSLVETMQQRIFARFALRLAYKLPQIKASALNESYTPELVNRFFDVLTIQKTMAKLLLTVPAAILQIIVGLTLLAFYSPLLLAFDLLILLGFFAVIFGLGIGGVKSSIEESKHKYEVAEWLEELGRCQSTFKLAGLPSYVMKRVDSLVLEYIHARKQHFRVIYRHAVGSALLYALASTGILAIGGWLVINKQLTLGQLVASELVVVYALYSLEKIIASVEEFYDLLTGLEKVGHITDLPVENRIEASEGDLLLHNDQGIKVACVNLCFQYEGNSTKLLDSINLEIAPGSHWAFSGVSGSGKTTMGSMICGLLDPTQGTILINDQDIRTLNLTDLRKHVAWVTHHREIFDGTVEENILMDRATVALPDLQKALQITDLDRDILNLPRGIKTRLLPDGQNISRSLQQQILLARALVKKPSLLILDEALIGLDELKKTRLMSALLDKENTWTLIAVSNDPVVVMKMEQVALFANNRIEEQGDPKALIQDPKSNLNKLFPSLLMGRSF